MFLFKLPILLLLGAVPFSSGETYFKFITILECQAQPNWCYKLTYSEKDLWIYGKVAGTDKKCVSGPVDVTELRGQERLDVIGLSKEFEIAIEILHSCTSTGAWKKIGPEIIMEVPVPDKGGSKNVDNTFKENISNFGEPCDEPND